MWCKGVLVGVAVLLSAGSARAQVSTSSPPEAAAPAISSPPRPRADPPARTRGGPDALARNDWTGGVDVSAGPLPGLSEDVVGAAVDGRFGYRLDNGRLFITPEAVLGLVVIARKLASQASLAPESAWIGAGLRAGARLWRFEPALYSHGFIWFGGRTTAPAVEAGIALDFRITRSFSMGAHAAYVLAAGDESIDFGIFGLHADLWP